MLHKTYLGLPGPTPVPERVQRAMQQPMINHRGPVFKEIFQDVVTGMKAVFNTTTADILTYPSSGTGVMEAGIVNLFSPGDCVLVLSVGNFGDRLAEIATSYGLNVEKVSVADGQAINLQYLQVRLATDVEHKIKGIDRKSVV